MIARDKYGRFISRKLTDQDIEELRRKISNKEDIDDILVWLVKKGLKFTGAYHAFLKQSQQLGVKQPSMISYLVNYWTKINT